MENVAMVIVFTGGCILVLIGVALFIKAKWGK
jgi:hypothetical protein